MNKPHPQAEFIIAKANGATIQFMHDESTDWKDMEADDWDFEPGYEIKFRIKPEPKYPETRMTIEEIDDIYNAENITWQKRFIKIANAAIRRSIQDGDVVLPGEKE